MVRKVSFYLVVVTSLVLIATGAFAAVTTYYDSKKYGPAYVGGALVGSTTTPMVTPTNVYVSPDGLGDALIYGYYNVRDGNANLFTIVNNDMTKGQRVAIRFFEGKTSYELLDFHICLTPGDMWTSYIRQNPNDPNGGAVLLSLDYDTYIDYVKGRGIQTAIFPVKFPNGVEFKYGSTYNLPTVTASDTLEGYFYIIGMGQLEPDMDNKGNCGPSWRDVVNGETPNVLSGHSYHINLTTGKTFAYVPTALANFYDAPYDQETTDADPKLSHSKDRLVGVNFVLTKENVSAMYYAYAGQPGTQLIVTFPTRRETSTSSLDIFDDSRVLLTVFDDKEQAVGLTRCNFSPCPPGEEIQLPNEVNVITIRNSRIFSTRLGVKIDLPPSHEIGWLNLNFVYGADTSEPVKIGGSPGHRTPFDPSFNRTLNGFVSWGLPAIAYVVTDIGNGINWMLPMHASYFVNDGTSAPPAPGKK